MKKNDRVVFIGTSNKYFPREVATPRRRVVRNWAEFKKFFERYKDVTDIYTSVYGYDKLKESGMKPESHTAIVDKVFFDLDPEDEPDKCWQNVKRLHRFLKERNIKHNIVFSGGGFHIYVFVKEETLMSKKGALIQASYWFIEQAGIDDKFVDTSVFGDLSQITRVPNSFNYKEHRRRCCIPLHKRHLDMTYDEICKEAEKGQNWTYTTWGSKKLDLVYFDEKAQEGGIKGLNNHYREELEEINLEDAESISLDSIQLPRCMKRIAQKGKEGGHTGYRARYLLITWLRDMGVDMEEAREFLKEHLKGSKPSRQETDYQHMINEVSYLKYGQLSDVYSSRREGKLFPKHETLIQEGWCKEHWGECQRLYKARTTAQGRDPREVFLEQKKEKTEEE